MKCDATALRVLYDDGRCSINNSFKVTKNIRVASPDSSRVNANNQCEPREPPLTIISEHFPPEPNNILLRSRVRAAK